MRLSHRASGKVRRVNTPASTPQKRTRIKVCGITRVGDAKAAVASGVDAIGLMFYPKSSRLVTVDQARELVAVIPALVSVVAVFADPEEAEVRAVVDGVAVDLLQFHGDESAAFCESFGRPYIKGVRMKAADSLEQAIAAHPGARAFLVDAYDPAMVGGTGHRFDWNTIAPERRPTVILAGGLNPDNVADAVRAVGPLAVDVSSGVESAPGIKDPQLIARFADAVFQA